MWDSHLALNFCSSLALQRFWRLYWLARQTSWNSRGHSGWECLVCLSLALWGWWRWCCKNAWGILHALYCLADQRYQELWLEAKDTLYTEPQWTPPPKTWTTKTNTEMGNSSGKDASLPCEGHWWLLKEILIQNWHYQGLVLGTGLHKSTD